MSFELLENRSLLSVVPIPPANFLAQPAFKIYRPSTFDSIGSTSPYGLTPNEIRGAYGLGTYASGVLSN
ncbi:MAG: hypothetical protein ABSG53_32465, partial [Thermoguttaceae bacterium]